MALKVLGQAASQASTWIDVYLVPEGKEAAVSTVVACNQSTVSNAYSIAVRPGNEALAQKHYIVYQASLPALSSDFLTVGVTLASGDVLSFMSTGSSMSVTMFGDES